jgi:hypothetical protein
MALWKGAGPTYVSVGSARAGLREEMLGMEGRGEVVVLAVLGMKRRGPKNGG